MKDMLKIFTVRLTSGSVGEADAYHVSIGDRITIEYHDALQAFIVETGIVDEILEEKEPYT